MRLRSLFLVSPVLAIALACGGGGAGTGSNLKGDISGVVTDASGNPVRNAKVFYNRQNGHYTATNANGSFILEDVPEGSRRIGAELTINGVLLYGENDVDVFGAERTKSVNIVMSRDDEAASMEGQVVDRFGDALENARVLFNVNGYGSRLVLTDEDGNFRAGALVPGVDYEVYATGRGYDSDATIIRFNVREERSGARFVLEDGSDPSLAAPTDVSVVAWTSPRVATTNLKGQDPTGALRGFFDKRGKRAAGSMRKTVDMTPKDSRNGNWIGVDVQWTPPDRDYGHIGYGLYRGTTATGNLTGIEFIRDTLTSVFFDSDSSLQEGVRYYYAVSSLNTLYPDTNDSESPLSARANALTLGDMTTRTMDVSALRFNWNRANFAEQYTVFVFDRYPSYGVDPVWPAPNNDPQLDAATTTGTSLVYAGPTLTRGRTYYYLVLGSAENFGSRTTSVVRSFQAP